MAKNTRPRDTSANRARKDKNPAFQRFGKSNGSFKHGTSPHAYRLKVGAKPGELVHHLNHIKSDVRKSNLKKLKPTSGSTALAKHNAQHPEKAVKATISRLKSQGKSVSGLRLRAQRLAKLRGK